MVMAHVLGDQVLDDRRFIAGLKLRTAEAVLPSLQRERAALDLFEAELLEKTRDISERKNRMEPILDSFAFQSFYDCSPDASAFRVRIDGKRPHFSAGG